MDAREAEGPGAEPIDSPQAHVAKRTSSMRWIYRGVLGLALTIGGCTIYFSQEDAEPLPYEQTVEEIAKEYEKSNEQPAAKTTLAEVPTPFFNDLPNGPIAGILFRVPKEKSDTTIPAKIRRHKGGISFEVRDHILTGKFDVLEEAARTLNIDLDPDSLVGTISKNENGVSAHLPKVKSLFTVYPQQIVNAIDLVLAEQKVRNPTIAVDADCTMQIRNRGLDFLIPKKVLPREGRRPLLFNVQYPENKDRQLTN